MSAAHLEAPYQRATDRGEEHVQGILPNRFLVILVMPRRVGMVMRVVAPRLAAMHSFKLSLRRGVSAVVYRG
jgi:hypothetical protein